MSSQPVVPMPRFFCLPLLKLLPLIFIVLDGSIPQIAAQVCQPVSTVGNFDLAQYTSAVWYSQQQRPTPFQPVTQNYCVTAQYTFLTPADPAAALGYSVHVFNTAQDEFGNVYTSDDDVPVGPNPGPLCAAQNAFPGDGAAELTVGQCFLPPTTFGQSNYWVVAYDEDDGYALISGGQPDVPTRDGLCTFSSPFSGLWIFSRSPERNEAMIGKYRQIAIDEGIDPSIMNDVNQKDCDYISGKYVQIRGESTPSGREACWEVRNGRTEPGNKIVLGRCAGRERNLFSLTPFTGEDGNTYVRIRPKLDPQQIVTGVRESEEKAWVRLEEGILSEADETQIFFALDSGMVGLGTDSSCSDDDTCLYVTNQGKDTDMGDPVMLTTKKRLDRFIKNGDVIVTWSFV